VFCIQKGSILAVSMVAGSSVTLWILRAIFRNLSSVVSSYRDVVVAYIGISVVVSFAICYYRGPITEPRLLDLIKWLLQAVGLLMVYAGCQVSLTYWNCRFWSCCAHSHLWDLTALYFII